MTPVPPGAAVANTYFVNYSTKGDFCQFSQVIPLMYEKIDKCGGAWYNCIGKSRTASTCVGAVCGAGRIALNLSLICTITVSAVALIYLVIGVIWGAKRGFARSLFRLISLAVSAVIAYLISISVFRQFGDMIRERILALADRYAAPIAEMLHASESLIQYVIAIAMALLAPLLYSILFMLLRGLLWILYAALCMFLPSKKKKPIDGLSRVTGVVVSIVGCFLIVISLLMPFTGYLCFAAVNYPKVIEAQVFINETLPAGLDTQLTDGADSKAVLAVNKLGGEMLFRKLSQKASDGRDLDLECDALLGLYTAIYDVSLIDFNAIFDETKEADLSAISVGLISAIDNSDVMKSILSEVLAFAAGQWENGETVLSINIKEQLPEGYETALDAPLIRLANTTPETVCQDLIDLTDSIETISETYVYLHKMSHVTVENTASQEELLVDMENILLSLTPGSAQLVSTALTTTIENNEKLKNQVGEENTAAIAAIVSDSLEGIAEMDEEERKAEAAAINNLISYTTTARRDEVSSEQLIDDILASSTVQTVVADKGQTDEETGEAKTTIQVTEKQKTEMDAAIDNRLADTENPLTEQEKATLEALRAMLKTKSSSSAPGGETTTGEGETPGS